jgi:hypothetical protein
MFNVIQVMPETTGHYQKKTHSYLQFPILKATPTMVRLISKQTLLLESNFARRK